MRYLKQILSLFSFDFCLIYILDSKLLLILDSKFLLLFYYGRKQDFRLIRYGNIKREEEFHEHVRATMIASFYQNPVFFLSNVSDKQIKGEVSREWAIRVTFASTTVRP